MINSTQVDLLHKITTHNIQGFHRIFCDQRPSLFEIGNIIGDCGKGKYSWADSVKLADPQSTTNEKLAGPLKNMGAPTKLLYLSIFEILKSCQKCIFGPVKHEKFPWCLVGSHYTMTVQIMATAKATHCWSPSRQGSFFADDIFRCIFVNEMFCILIEISLRFFPRVQ